MSNWLDTQEVGIDFSRRSTFRPRGSVPYEWPPVNPIPRDQFTYDPVPPPPAERPRWLVYTTEDTLVTTAGLRFYLPRRIKIISARISVDGAPSGGALIGDILKNGNSIYPTSPTPRCADGEKYGKLRKPDRRNAKKDDYLQCQLTTLNGATGPAIFYIQYRRVSA